MSKMKVLIVDDSKMIREWLTQLVESDPELSVIGTAVDPYEARSLIKKSNPDVILLDIIMPKMDGITFLKRIMHLHPIPVVMISSLTETGSVVALEALSSGAIDYFPKPSKKEYEDFEDYRNKLILTIKNAARSNIKRTFTSNLAKRKIEHIVYHSDLLKKIVIAIGSSTGGIEAVEEILSNLPKTFPPIVLVQHLHVELSSAFVSRMNKIVKNLKVKLAKNNEEIVPGCVYLAPSHMHLCIHEAQNKFIVCFQDIAPVHGNKPSIDVLFSSLAHSVANNAVGILLSGRGEDGAAGAKEIHDAGGVIIAQDKESSVVWDIPEAAVKQNVVDYVKPLSEISETLFSVLDNIAQKRL